MAAWLKTLKRWFGAAPAERPSAPPPSEEESREAAPAPEMGEQHAAHGGEDPAPLHHGRRRLKETYTSHWDLDYLPREEVEKIARENEEKK